MNRRQFNKYVFLVEGLNALGTTFYINYLFFFLKNHFAFTSKQNLLVCALNGLIFAPFALIGGRVGQRYGYMNALGAGGAIMIVSLAFSALFTGSVIALMAGMVLWTVGMCFTWPNLEALASDHQDPARLPAVLGVYNVVWSAGGALANFFGGAVAETLGWLSIFWVPIVIHIIQIALVLRLAPAWKNISTAPVPRTGDLHEAHPRGPLFLKMAWLANPLAYIAINTVIPLIPDVAAKLGMSPKFAGFFCSIWFFSRSFTFVVLAFWPGWHYRFDYLALAYVGMLMSFGGILLLKTIPGLVLVQIAFGWCIGLIYYSSLYYSMHVGETKAEHGGVHEAAIGLGIFGGPAIGAASLQLFPAYSQSSVYGVTIVLAAGFGALCLMGRRRRGIQRRL